MQPMLSPRMEPWPLRAFRLLGRYQKMRNWAPVHKQGMNSPPTKMEPDRDPVPLHGKWSVRTPVRFHWWEGIPAWQSRTRFALSSRRASWIRPRRKLRRAGNDTPARRFTRSRGANRNVQCWTPMAVRGSLGWSPDKLIYLYMLCMYVYYRYIYIYIYIYVCVA